MESIAAPDYKLAQELYGQGVAPVDIAQRCGMTEYALSAYARRHGWANLRRSAQAAAREGIGEEIRECLVQNVLRDARRYGTQEKFADVHSPEYDTFTRSRERLFNTVSKLFGWEAGPRDPLSDAKPARCIEL